MHRIGGMIATLCIGVGAAATTGVMPPISHGESTQSEGQVHSVSFVGTVTAADGSPVGGAVVVSTLGGRSISDARGLFRLEIHAIGPIEGTRVTAVATLGGVTRVGSVEVRSPRDQVMVDVGPFALLSDGSCDPAWLPTFGVVPGTDGAVSAMAVYDDGLGDGPALFVAGAFDIAGATWTQFIAKWNGSAWSTLGSGLNSHANCLAVFDDGSGKALYVGGQFTQAGGRAANRIARWDGKEWSPLGSGFSAGSVRVLAVFDDGSGSALFAGGNFGSGNIRRWNGAAWSQLGVGVSGGSVLALKAFDDRSGAGAALFVGGSFTSAGGTAANRVARWDGSSWSPLGSGMNNSVLDLEQFDDGRGDGPMLHACGTFTTAGGVSANRLARWNGSAWSALGSGANTTVNALAVHADRVGSRPALYAVGSFIMIGGVSASKVARWDGSAWSSVGTGVPTGSMAAILSVDGGPDASPTLFVAGEFANAGAGPANNIARWDGSVWSPLGSGLAAPAGTPRVLALTVFDDGLGDGPALIVGGEFSGANGLSLGNIGKWNGTSWTALGSGVDSGVRALVVFDDNTGSGEALYAGGDFTSAGGVSTAGIARWNGLEWSSVGGGLTGPAAKRVMSMTVFDGGDERGPELVVGGRFSEAGGTAAKNIAKWNGTSWSPLGSGLGGVSPTEVGALASFVDGGGSGPSLYVGGYFTNAGGVSVNGIARWDGFAWSDVNGGITGGPLSRVNALRVAAVGAESDPALFVGGDFSHAGGVAAGGIAKWDGTRWTALGNGIEGDVYALAHFDDGAGGGPALFAGGNFDFAGGVLAPRVAKWDGTTWASIGTGFDYQVLALHAMSPGDDVQPSLFMGGDFLHSPSGDSTMARWQGCLIPSGCASSDLNCDGHVDGTDLALLLGQWGPCRSTLNCDGDLDGDGSIGPMDVAILLQEWSPSVWMLGS